MMRYRPIARELRVKTTKMQRGAVFQNSYNDWPLKPCGVPVCGPVKITPRAHAAARIVNVTSRTVKGSPRRNAAYIILKMTSKMHNGATRLIGEKTNASMLRGCAKRMMIKPRNQYILAFDTLRWYQGRLVLSSAGVAKR